MTERMQEILEGNHHPQLYRTLVDGLLREYGYMLELGTFGHEKEWMITPNGVKELEGWSDTQYRELHQVGDAKIADYRAAIAQYLAEQAGTNDMNSGAGAGEGQIYHY
ncbi:MAG: hypothetical protein AAB557_03635 [Patescibacteria group bacterium]